MQDFTTINVYATYKQLKLQVAQTTQPFTAKKIWFFKYNKID